MEKKDEEEHQGIDPPYDENGEVMSLDSMPSEPSLKFALSNDYLQGFEDYHPEMGGLEYEMVHEEVAVESELERSE